MGWLDNSTNNIILDAVLTDYGRQALAQASQSTTSAITFNFKKFALGDDEINYGIIKQYGRTVGREKIEKNTPIFEAFTNQSIALKYKLFTSQIPLLYVPKYEITTPALPIQLATAANGFAESGDIIVTQKAAAGTPNNALDPQIKESEFTVIAPSLFLYLVGGGGTELSGVTQQATTKSYKINGAAVDSTSNDNQVTLTFKIRTRVLPQSIFDVYGNSNNIINTSVRVVGSNTGTSVDIPVTISYT